jgi:hypothetical protein
MGIFRRKKKPAAIGTKGQPVHVNLPADANPRLKRNLARIAKCKFYMDHFKPGTKEHNSWKKEYDRRKLFLAERREAS